jgi:TonB family protein
MRKVVTKLAPIALLLIVFTALSLASELPAQTVVTISNWRELKTVRFGRAQIRTEVSGRRTVRVITEADTTLLVTAELRPDSLRLWHDRILSDFDKLASTKYAFENSILIEPYTVEGAQGYALTLADTNGVARAVVTDAAGVVEFLDLLLTGVMAATRFTDADLQRAGPVVETPVSLAKPVTAVYPRNARLAGVSGKAVVQFVVDTSGRARPETINCLEATYKDFADAAVGTVKTMVFNPATLDGHKIERLVQYPFDFKLNAVLPISPFPVPTRGDRRR